MIALQLFAGCLQQLAPYMFLCLYPFRKRLRFPKRKIFLVAAALLLAASLLFSLAGAFLASILPRGPFLRQMVNCLFALVLPLCFFWYLYTVKDLWQKKLFVFSFTATAALLMTSIYNYFDVKNLQSYSWLPYGGTFYLYYLIAELVTLPPCWFLLKYFYLPIEDGLDARESGYLSALSLFLFALLIPGLSLTAPEYLHSNPALIYLFCSLLVITFVVYILFFKLYGLIREKMQSQQEAMQLQHQSELSAEQYRRIQEQIENSRRMRHDLTHHLLAIQSFLADGETGRAVEYLEQYLESTRKYEILRFCGNPVVNMLVSHYDALAKEEEIDFSVRINIPDGLPVQDTDLSVLLGNLLDNAVRAAGHVTEADRFVRLNMICSGKMLAITVDNGFDGHVKRDGERYMSTKEGHQGMGLKSIADISEKYHGGVEFTHEGVEFHASVMVGLE